MEINQEKAWIVGRIDQFLLGVQDELKSAYQQLEAEMDKDLTIIITIRNGIIASISAVATAIIGIMSLDKFKDLDPILFSGLIALIIIGAVTFAMLTFISYRINISFRKIKIAYLALLTRVNFIHGYSVTTTSDLGSVTVDELKRLLDFAIVVSDDRVLLRDLAKKAAGSILLRKRKKDFAAFVETQDFLIKDGLRIYKKHLESYTSQFQKVSYLIAALLQEDRKNFGERGV